jgi:hypothetical protein
VTVSSHLSGESLQELTRGRRTLDVREFFFQMPPHHGLREVPQAVKLEVAAGSPTKLQEPAIERRRTGRPACWQSGHVGHLTKDSGQRNDELADKVSGNE